MATSASGLPPYVAAEHQQQLKHANRVAMLMAPRLGDTLLMMNMVQNLRANGRSVTVFGDYAYALRAWFPGIDIRPSLPESEASHALADYDCAAQMHVGWPYGLHDYARSYFYYDEHVVVTGKGFIKLNQIRDYCHQQLGLENCSLNNGLRPLPELRHRQHLRRVAVHPSSGGEERRWAASHFVELGKRLQRSGYQPFYILAPYEREQWACLAENGLSIYPSTLLSDVATFIHESGWFVGNESGIGHLASNVGIPTLTVTGRPTRTLSWRPGWSTSRIVYPGYIPGGRLRDRLWRHWLKPRQVLRAFRQLTDQYEKQISE
ncbi:glycosyltransferase family 9 protein [Bordetella tumulicola]|uniref:glycosyltransferase family 9 protein n=1 Tax=Bordetella tumulicola TaxID=1649133 RepID=UPI0039EFA440